MTVMLSLETHSQLIQSSSYFKLEIKSNNSKNRFLFSVESHQCRCRATTCNTDRIIAVIKVEKEIITYMISQWVRQGKLIYIVVTLLCQNLQNRDDNNHYAQFSIESCRKMHKAFIGTLNKQNTNANCSVNEHFKQYVFMMVRKPG